MDPFVRQVYHRRETRTQTPHVARTQEEAGEIWGTYNRDAMGGRTPFPSVDAYRGRFHRDSAGSNSKRMYHRIAIRRRTLHAGQDRATV